VVGFDLDRLALRGEPVRVSESLQVDVMSAPNYAVSRTGVLAYVPVRDEARSFVWVDRRTGHETAIDGLPPRPYRAIGLSRDGTRMAYHMSNVQGIHAWDFARKRETRLTLEAGSLPQWTSDGRVVFASSRAGPQNLYIVASDGSGSIERLTTSNQIQFMNSITPDGFVLFCEMRPKTGYDIIRLRLPSPQGAARPAERLPEATPLLSTSAAEYAPSVSPDGRYFAYRSNASGRGDEVYVLSYPDATKGPWQISTEGGMAPVWSQSGAEIFYLDASNTMMAVPVETSGPQFIYGKPAKVFEKKYWGNFYSYDLAPDGRFLMMKENPGDRSQASIVVVLNWFEELRRRVPAQ
jgi:serine/threonine-protein kinase